MDFRLRDFRYPFTIWKARRQLEKTQYWSPERLEELQMSSLARLLDHCHRNVPYYRMLFKKLGCVPGDFRTPADLKALPVLTKQTVRENLGSLISENCRSFAPRLSHTGGTTGTALDFYVDRQSNIMEFATVWRHWNRAGYRFGDRFCDLRGRIILGSKPWSFDWRLNALFLSSFRLTRENVDEYAKVAAAFKPRILRGYPSAIDIFARLLREKRITSVRPVAVITNSETLLLHQRKNLEEVFACPVFETYGLEERVAAMGQCSAGRLHEDSEYGIVEYGAGNGDGLAAGELICTGLHNLAMPLIRYRTNDIGSRVDGPCACGSGLPSVQSIHGRLEDMVVTPDGRYVTGSGLSVAVKYSPGIRRSQIIQEDRQNVRVLILRSPQYGSADETQLLRGLRERLGNVININLEYVDDIPLTAAGKLKFVISRVPLDVN